MGKRISKLPPVRSATTPESSTTEVRSLLRGLTFSRACSRR
jgi:hypothetical protein